MNEKITFSHVRFELLNEMHHPYIRQFRNRESEIEKFLKEDAIYNQKVSVSKTYLAFLDIEQKELIGYVTLLNDMLEFKEDEELTNFFRQKDIPYNSLPSIKIGRLGREQDEKFEGCGEILVQFAIAKAYFISDMIGCRFLTLDAKNNQALIEYYEKLGFRRLHKKPKNMETITMYFELYLNKASYDIFDKKSI